MPLSAAQTIPQEVTRSLGAAHGSVHVPKTGSVLRRFLSFAGPGYLVATGYMDPGNWATALAGGSSFGMALLFVAVLSSLMAIVLQALVGTARIRDGTRSRPELRPSLFSPNKARLLAGHGASDHRDRPRRSHWHRDRA